MDTRRERISERAYAIWEREGRPEGRAEHYWHVAEAEIDQEMTEPAGAQGTKAKKEKSAGKVAKPSPKKRGK
jgi:Protein of unknown function (DUF2934)